MNTIPGDDATDQRSWLLRWVVTSERCLNFPDGIRDDLRVLLQVQIHGNFNSVGKELMLLPDRAVLYDRPVAKLGNF